VLTSAGSICWYQEGFYSNVTPELALATIASLTVLGALQASPEVRAALAGRVR
jgi:hypothetical protein